MRNYWHPDFPPQEPKQSKLMLVFGLVIVLGLLILLAVSGYEAMGASLDQYHEQRLRLEGLKKPPEYSEEAMKYEIWGVM